MPQNGITNHVEIITLDIQGFLNSVYYSFVTATTTGYGDFIPLGISRFLSALEAIFGYILLGVVISKVVSVKQNNILDELYHISYEEAIERLRSELYLYRTDLRQEISAIDKGELKNKDIKDLWVIFSGINNTLQNIRRFIKPKNSQYGKRIDPFKLELLLNSIRLSLNKINDLLHTLEENKFKWKTDMISSNLDFTITSCNRIKDESLKIFQDKKIEEKNC
jgi:hypothetical protein